MAHSLKFEVTVELERETGKFASVDELQKKIVEAIDQANPDTVEGDNGGQYNVTVWEVTSA